MANDFFAFKEFTIHQSHCAMKVSTDACILGAWTPVAQSISNVLDIGTGTGLLSLMLCQRCNELNIDALEIDENAYRQAAQNIANTAYANKIQIHLADAKTWESQVKYDLIICNPPFFSNNLKGSNTARNIARHNDELDFESLAIIIESHLSTNGFASILLPYSEIDNWLKAMKSTSLKIQQHLMIKPFEHHNANRTIFILGRTEKSFLVEELIIYKEPKIYTTEFTKLMAPFYLHL